MAKFNSTTFGTISGRHGTAVAATTKDGQCILRVFKAPSNPRTDAQVAQRAKFAMVNHNLSVLSEQFKITFGSSRGINQAVSLALANAVTGSYPNFALDYSQLTVATGSVQKAETVSCKSLGSSKVEIDWDATAGTPVRESDAVSVLFFNEASQLPVLKESIALRKDGKAEVTVPTVWAGASVHCWIYFTAPDGSQTSTSQYISQLAL